MLVEPSILTAVPVGTESGGAKVLATTGGEAPSPVGATVGATTPPTGVGGDVLLPPWGPGLFRKKNQPPPASKRNNRIKTMGGGPLLAIKFSLVGKFFVVGAV